MEKIIQRKEQSQYLSLIVKKIAKDRLNLRESKSYEALKLKVDPYSYLENELTLAWIEAEKMKIEEQNAYENNMVNGRSWLSNVRYRFLKNF